MMVTVCRLLSLRLPPREREKGLLEPAWNNRVNLPPSSTRASHILCEDTQCVGIYITQWNPSIRSLVSKKDTFHAKHHSCMCFATQTLP